VAAAPVDPGSGRTLPATGGTTGNLGVAVAAAGAALVGRYLERAHDAGLGHAHDDHGHDHGHHPF